MAINDTVVARTVFTLCAVSELENVLAEHTEVENRSGLFEFLELLRAGLTVAVLSCEMLLRNILQMSGAILNM